MGAPVPPSVVAAFTFGGSAGVDYTLIPVASQIGVSPELASFTTGFPPATRIARTSGGIPPRGLDMNGILFMATGHVAWLASGNAYTFNADVVTVTGGYNIGAVIRSAVTPTLRFMSLVADNVQDPDVSTTGWLPFNIAGSPTETLTPTVAAGSQTIVVSNRYGFVDLNATAGAATITDFTGGDLGQIITVTSLHATNNVTIQSGANIRMPGNLTLTQNNSISLRRRTATQWVAMS